MDKEKILEEKFALASDLFHNATFLDLRKEMNDEEILKYENMLVSSGLELIISCNTLNKMREKKSN